MYRKHLPLELLNEESESDCSSQLWIFLLRGVLFNHYLLDWMKVGTENHAAALPSQVGNFRVGNESLVFLEWDPDLVG